MKFRVILALAAFSIGLIFSASVFAEDSKNTKEAELAKEAATMRKTFSLAAGACSKYSCTSNGFEECKNNSTCNLDDDLTAILKKTDKCDPEEEDYKDCLGKFKKSQEKLVRDKINEATKKGSCRGSSFQDIATKFKERNTAATSLVKENKTQLNDVTDKLNKKKEEIQKERKNLIDEQSKTENAISALLENKANLESDATDRITAMKNDIEDQRTLIQSLMDQQHEVELRYTTAIQKEDQRCINLGLTESKLKAANLNVNIKQGTNKLQSVSDVLTTANQGGADGNKNIAFKTVTAECIASVETRNAKTNAASVKQIELNKLSTALRQAVAKSARMELDLKNFGAKVQTKSKLAEQKRQMLEKQAQQGSQANTQMLELYMQQAAKLEKKEREEEAALAEATTESLASKLVNDALPGGKGTASDDETQKAILSASGFASTQQKEIDAISDADLKNTYTSFTNFGKCSGSTPANAPNGKAADKPTCTPGNVNCDHR